MNSTQSMVEAEESSLNTSTRLQHRIPWLIGLSVLGVGFAILATGFALVSGRTTIDAQERAQLALAGKLAAQSQIQLELNNDLAWLLAIEAGRRAETVETFAAVRAAFAAPGRTVTILSGHMERVGGATWNPDETRIATFSNDGTVRVWDTLTEAELVALIGHTDWVNQAVWSADGTRILTAGDDDTARVWDVANGTELLTSPDHK